MFSIMKKNNIQDIHNNHRKKIFWVDPAVSSHNRFELVFPLQEINDLKEQLRDLMFFLEAQETLNKTPDKMRQEIQDGQITIGASPSPDGRQGRRGRKKGK